MMFKINTFIILNNTSAMIIISLAYVFMFGTIFILKNIILINYKARKSVKTNQAYLQNRQIKRRFLMNRNLPLNFF